MKLKGLHRVRTSDPKGNVVDAVLEIRHLARSNDSPPGNTVMWRGMRRLADMQLGFNLASERYG